MSGVLVDSQLQRLVESGAIRADVGIAEDQVQPNSLDLRIGPAAYRVRASFLPSRDTVRARIEGGLSLYEVDLRRGAILERNAIYLIPLRERLSLPPGTAGKANPKSSTGRLDVFCRAVTDHAPGYDEIAEGYEGEVFLEVVPRSFSVKLREGDRLSQLRLFEGDPVLSDAEIEKLLGADILVRVAEDPGARPIVRGGMHFGVSLRGREGETVGYVAKPNHNPIEIARPRGCRVSAYWEPIPASGTEETILEPDLFYIFSSREMLGLGPAVCAEMQAYDVGMGELRSHYAGFFDSGFGFGAAAPSRIVLEVRNHHVPYLLAHGQVLFRVLFMRNQRAPARLYGQDGRASNYQGQGLRLAKQFGAP